MKVWLAIGFVLLVLVGAAVGGWMLLPRFSPQASRDRAVRLLEGGRCEEGLARLRQYVQRFPAEAMGEPEILIGRPLRLRIEFREHGLLLDGPPVEKSGPADAAVDPGVEPVDTAADVTVEAGPIWTSPTQVVYAAAWRDGGAKLVRLDVAARQYEEIDLPDPPWMMSFAASVALLGAEPAVYQLRPKLGGASQPYLVAVSPDRSWLVFRAAVEGDPPYELWRCRLDGSDAARLTTLRGACQDAAFSPDGTQLAYFDGPSVRIVRLADTESRELVGYESAAVLLPAAPAWTPDSGKLAWGVGSSDEFRLVVCATADGSKPAERPRLHSLSRLEVLADEWLLQSQQEFGTDRRVVTLRLPDDRFASRVLEPDALDATLSPDGAKLAFRSGGRLRVFWLNVPLRQFTAEQLPPAELPERPAGPPPPASTPPGDASPKPPAPPTTPL